MSSRSAPDQLGLQPPPIPRSRGFGPRRFLAVLVFFCALAVSVGLWWPSTPVGALDSQASVLLAAGRITGLMSGFILLVEILTMTRVPWIESWFGVHGLLAWHRSLGGLLVILSLAHAVLLVMAYAWASKTPLLDEAWSMVTTLKDMITATVATGILVVAGVLSARVIRRWLPYELWHGLHLSLYAVVFLAYGHQFALGAAVLKPGFAESYWIGLHVFVGGCFVWGRILRPLWFNLRHRFYVLDVVDEGPHWVSLYIGGRRLDRVRVETGQYFRWRFLARRCWWQAHPFSVSAPPNGEWLRVSVKVCGGHTRILQDLQVGTRVLLSEATGCFTARRRVTDKALLVAAGSGIAPIVGLLEDLPGDTVVLYRARTADDLVFREELEHLANERRATVYFVLGSRNDHWPQRAFSSAGVRRLVPDLPERDVYLCGPPSLIKDCVRTLRWMGLPRRQLHVDSYEF